MIKTIQEKMLVYINLSGEWPEAYTEACKTSKMEIFAKIFSESIVIKTGEIFRFL